MQGDQFRMGAGSEPTRRTRVPGCRLDRRIHAGCRWSKKETGDANEPLLTFAVETVPWERQLAIIHPCRQVWVFVAIWEPDATQGKREGRKKKDIDADQMSRSSLELVDIVVCLDHIRC